MRGNKLSNRVFDTSEEVRDVYRDGSVWLVAQPERITSIGICEWAVH